MKVKGGDRVLTTHGKTLRVLWRGIEFPYISSGRFVCVVVGGGANVRDSVAGGCESVATGYTLFLFGSYFFGWFLD
jgi:hypothetical protein